MKRKNIGWMIRLMGPGVLVSSQARGILLRKLSAVLLYLRPGGLCVAGSGGETAEENLNA